MSFGLRIRDRFMNRTQILRKRGITEGQTVLDFGCGLGSFSIPAAKIVGDNGKVYALDIHPLAVEAITKKIRKEGLANIEVIHSDRDTSLADESVDVILLYGVLHDIKDKQTLLVELHRVLKPEGILSIMDPPWKIKEILGLVDESGLLSLKERHGRLLNLQKDLTKYKGGGDE